MIRQVGSWKQNLKQIVYITHDLAGGDEIDHGAGVEAAAGDRGRDGDADRLQGASGRLLLHGGQVRRGAPHPCLRPHAPMLQGRLRRAVQDSPLLRPRLRDARLPLVEALRPGLLPQGTFVKSKENAHFS